MLLFSTITGLLLSLILLVFNSRKYPSTIYLGIFFFLISLYGLAIYALMYSKSVFLVSILYLNINFLAYLIGPLLYWYIRGVLTDNSQLKKSDLWHFLPMFIFLISSIPYILTPYSHKIEIAGQIVQDPNFLRNYSATFMNEILPVSTIYLIRPIHVFAYTIWSAILLIRYLTQKRKLLILSRQYFMIKWIPFLLGFLPLAVISHILLLTKVFADQSPYIFYSLKELQLLSQAGLLGLLLSPFFFPRILYGLPRLPDSMQEMSSDEEDGKVTNSDEKTRHIPHYEKFYLLSIRQRIDACMNESLPFLKPDFNIAHLSVMTMIPVHHLAYYFREEKKQSFNDYRNEWRINYAKNLIREGENAKLTLEAIGLLSGFPSRNAFFTAFKKSDGIAPGVFASHILKEPISNVQ